MLLDIPSRCKGAVLSILIIIALVAWWLLTGNQDALWLIESTKCIPGQHRRENPFPCIEVDETQGTVVLKDRTGFLQFLLMPTIPLIGIESPILLDDNTPNYFQYAWNARHFLSESFDNPINDADLSLAINSKYGRSQSQLHIHITCLRLDVQESIARYAENIRAIWQVFPTLLAGHEYLARKVTKDELNKTGGFRLLADGAARAQADMGDFGMVMAQLPDGNFILLATKTNFLQLNFGEAEELQDHDCHLLTAPAPSTKRINDRTEVLPELL